MCIRDRKSYGQIFDSISICLSKGLGAPVGSLLLGNHAFIKQARRTRKLFGGGMRQAGFLAAAGIYALENNIKKLEEDHNHAKAIATALSKQDFIGEILPVETNIVIFEVKGKYTAASFAEYLKEKNILCIPISSTQVRMVTHLDVSLAMIERLLKVIEEA
jgi:threonine aldolase